MPFALKANKTMHNVDTLCIEKMRIWSNEVVLCGRLNQLPDFLNNCLSKAFMAFRVQMFVIHRRSLYIIGSGQEGIAPFLRDCLVSLLQLCTGVD